MGRAVTTYARPVEVGASVTTTRNRLASGVPLEFSATEPVLVRDHNQYRPRPEDHAVGLCWSRVVTGEVIQVVVDPKQLLDTLHGSTQSAYCIAIRDH